MIKKEPIDWKGLIFCILGVIVFLWVGYYVIQEQIIQVQEYCQELVDNHTIQNMSECNITVEGLAQIRGCNISITDQWADSRCT